MAMILARVEQSLREQRRSSLRDLAEALGTAPEALRGMLELLERKGRVRRLPGGTPCAGGCCKCAPESIELYEWQEQARRIDIRAA